MNKNLIITALLVAVSCQPVLAVSDVSMMSKAFSNVTSFIANHKLAVGATVGVSALLVAGYQYLTREQAWVEGNCLNFKKCNFFGTVVSEYSVCFKTPEEAISALLVCKKGNFFGGVPKDQKSFSSTPMSADEIKKFNKALNTTLGRKVF